MSYDDCRFIMKEVVRNLSSGSAMEDRLKDCFKLTRKITRRMLDTQQFVELQKLRVEYDNQLNNMSYTIDLAGSLNSHEESLGYLVIRLRTLAQDIIKKKG